jgi:formylmethanofuran dehydrogenase subunit E
MKAKDIIASKDFQKCIDFHGHLCPGLSLGYRASQAAMARLESERSLDEEIVAVVETDACCADAVQVITGCTFGKGNFIYKDHGKMAFSFLNRDSGRGVRLVLKSDTVPRDPRHMELIEKLQADTASESERAEFQKLHENRSFEILETPIEDLFSLKELTIDLPPKAKIEPSKPCERCDEPTMVSKLSLVKQSMLCKTCQAAAQG